MPDRLRWLDRIPLAVIVAIAVFLVLAPFVPEPHVWEKLKMFAAGTLVRPIDIFDLLWHASPLVLLAMKVWRVVRIRYNKIIN
jgi:hypothetical protein